MLSTYWSVWECPEEGCAFIFRFENALTEDEGAEMCRAVARLHLRQRHPDIDPQLNVQTREAPGRPALKN